MPHKTARSVCPHDCPSTCALEVELLDDATVGKIRGPKDNPYSRGVICAKVARYADRVHHPERLGVPLRRIGAKGEGRFEEIGWEGALDIVADAFRKAANEFGAESVWPYQYAGTMGHVQRDGLERLRNVMGYSRQAKTICATVARTGWRAGHGDVRGADAREMTESDLIVIWGMNAVHTQVHVVEWARRARKERGTRIVVIDPYRNPTAEMADQHIAVNPGTDGAFACAVMHVLFKEGFADRDYLDRFAADVDGFEAHLANRTPAWAETITGIPEAEIFEFARLYGRSKKSFIRLGYGLTRNRNGAVIMHAASCLPVVTGAWQHLGGGALYSHSGIYGLDKSLIEGSDAAHSNVRELDMSQIGRVLTGNAEALRNGPPVKAMIIQNTNPVAVAPESALVREGFLRDDLFVCVHEQFMTETAQMADIVLPATTFLEHEDLYTAGGHTHLQVAKPVIKRFAQARPNHEVVCGLARRLGAGHPGFSLDAWALIDKTLKASGYPDAETVLRDGGCDRMPDFDDAHYLNGFATSDGRFHFAPDWQALGSGFAAMPRYPDHAEFIEQARDDRPFRMVTAPSWNFLNSTFTETPMSRKIQKRPTVLMHPEDCESMGISTGDLVRLGNHRGNVALHAKAFDGLQRGVVVVEGVWPNNAFVEGRGINYLVGADPIAPAGGAAFHDTAVWVRPA